MNNWLDRTERLIGTEKLNILKKSTIAIFGIGGVGSYVLEALARSGIENLIIIDKDIVDITNINRQLIATHSSIGQSKTSVAKKRLLDINPNCNVIAIKEFVNKENIVNILNKYNVTKCYYGHLHGKAHDEAVEGRINGIDYKLVSADYLKFDLLKID